MLIPTYKKKFAKDVKRLKKRGRDLEKLKTIANELINGNVLDKKYLAHPLKGEYSDCYECHIEPDWLLIYSITTSGNGRESFVAEIIISATF